MLDLDLELLQHGWQVVRDHHVGLLHEATGGWSLVIVLLMLTSVPLTLAGLRVARPSYVDDEI